MEAISQIENVFGIHTASTAKLFAPKDKGDDKNIAKFMNGLMVLSYIPVFGAIAGIFRMFIGLGIMTHDKEQRVFGGAMFLRGLMEFLALGGLALLVVDMAVSIKRHHSQERVAAPAA